MYLLVALCLLCSWVAPHACRSVDTREPPSEDLEPFMARHHHEGNIAELLIPLLERSLAQSEARDNERAHRRSKNGKKVIQVLPYRGSEEHKRKGWRKLNSHKKQVVEITPLHGKNGAKPLAYILSAAKPKHTDRAETNDDVSSSNTSELEHDKSTSEEQQSSEEKENSEDLNANTLRTADDADFPSASSNVQSSEDANSKESKDLSASDKESDGATVESDATVERSGDKKVVVIEESEDEEVTPVSINQLLHKHLRPVKPVTLPATIETDGETVENEEATVEDVAATVEEVAATVEEVAATVEDATTTVEDKEATIEADATVEADATIEASATVEATDATVEARAATIEDVGATDETVGATVEERAATVEDLAAVEDEAVAVEDVEVTVEDKAATIEEEQATVEDNATVEGKTGATVEDVAATVEDQLALEDDATVERAASTIEVDATVEQDGTIEDATVERAATIEDDTVLNHVHGHSHPHNVVNDVSEINNLIDTIGRANVENEDTVENDQGYIENDIVISRGHHESNSAEKSINKLFNARARDIIELIQSSVEASTAPQRDCAENAEKHHDHKSYRLSFLFNK